MKIPVLLPNIFNHPFTYITELKFKPGDYVSVPFGKTEMTGVVWDEFEKSENKKFVLKKIIKKHSVPAMNLNTLKFINWFSNYNLVPKGMSLKLHMLSNQIVENFNDKEYQFYNKLTKPIKYTLYEEQKNSLDEMINNTKNFNVHLLQGTTGSGKTIVYFNVIKHLIEKKFQVLILLPEIGLTSEFEKKFKDFFGFEPAVWQSSISKKKKKIIWSGL